MTRPASWREECLEFRARSISAALVTFNVSLSGVEKGRGL